MADQRPFDLVIFDCDGVLVDSERLSVELDTRFLATLGWPLTHEEIVERFVGRTDAETRSEIEAHLGRDIGPEWDAFNEEYIRLFATELVAVDGIHGAVDVIQGAGFATCVASSGQHDKIRRSLTKTGLIDRFEGRIFSGTDVANGKPAPDLFLHAAERLGVSPARSIVVEDSRHGVTAARAAGMAVLAYSGSVTPAHLLEGPATVVFDEMRLLPRLLGLEPA